MLLIIKIALIFFVLAAIMCGIAGSILCYQFTKRFNSTVRTMLYSQIIIITAVTIAMNLSYKGLPLLVMYGIFFFMIGLLAAIFNPKKYLFFKEL